MTDRGKPRHGTRKGRGPAAPPSQAANAIREVVDSAIASLGGSLTVRVMVASRPGHGNTLRYNIPDKPRPNPKVRYVTDGLWASGIEGEGALNGATYLIRAEYKNGVLAKVSVTVHASCLQSAIREAITSLPRTTD